VSGMFKHPERVTLNLVLNGEPFDRFMVTKSSWENFLQKLSEKDLTNQSASTYIPSGEASSHGIVEQKTV
jgi:hypothetical protein